MDKGKEKGILKLEPRPRAVTDGRSELTPQVSSELVPSSPQPSVDRLSVTWADPGSMASSGVNLFHLPSETPINNEVKFSPSTGDGSEDEDYSASLSAVLRQRRASVRRSRKGRPRRPSSPFAPDDARARRRSSVFTTSSGDTAISMEEGQPLVVSQEQIFENIHLHKEVLGSVKQQPLGMRRKLKIVHQAKAYIKRHEGQLQERLAQSKSTRDIYARFNILIATKWQQLKREAANTSNLLVPWELRIKEIESHFGSVVASYFTFLRWLFWVNLVIAFILLVFVIVPEYLTANPQQDGERKIIMEEQRGNASNLLILWEFEGILKYSPIFYGYYSNVERPQYRMPLAYFLTGLAVYIYSFVAILRKMAENSRMSKLSEKEDECIFSWKLFTGWDFMIGNTETAHNRIASVILGFKEALLEEAEKKKDLRNWRIISLRALVNICVIILLAVSAFAVVTVVSRSDDNTKARSWWRENETTIVVTVISITFPVFFELLGFLEHYHPRKQLRLQLARIMLLNLLNLYSLIFALFSKIEGMSKDLDTLKPNLTFNAVAISNNTLNISESLALNVPMACFEVQISCAPCNIPLLAMPSNLKPRVSTRKLNAGTMTYTNNIKNTIVPIKDTAESFLTSKQNLLPQNLMGVEESIEITTESSILQVRRELDRLRKLYPSPSSLDDASSETVETDYTFENTDSDYSFSEETSDHTVENSYYFTTDEINVIKSSVEPNYKITEEMSSTKEITDFSTSTYLETDYSDVTTKSDYTVPESTTVDVSSTIVTSETETQSTNSDLLTTTSTLHEDTTVYNSTLEPESTISSMVYTLEDITSSLATIPSIEATNICPNVSFNCTVDCGGKNVTQVFLISNCTVVQKTCYTMQCKVLQHKSNATAVDIVYEDKQKRKMYNLTKATKIKLLKLCWETMFGQELVKLTMMDLVFVLLGTLFMDFFRALFVRYMNRCWCWDLEKKFPQYGDFKIAENILHLINNQGMVWMGMFFSPGLVVLNVSKLMIMMYLRSWAVMTCNVPHEVVFRVSKSNNFYLALLLTMLFLCVLPVGYTIVWVKPSWHCGPFSEYEKIYCILTTNIYKILPKSLNFVLEYVASPAIVIPLLVLLTLIIYYLTSLTNSLREANNDLKIQLRRERTEERRKMFQLADTRRRAGSSVLDSTPFARWKKALPALPLSKSIDSDDRKTSTGEEVTEPLKTVKKKGGIFAKIVNLALDKKPDVDVVHETDNNVDASPTQNNLDDDDTYFHEALPKNVLKIKDITIKYGDSKKRNIVEFQTDLYNESKSIEKSEHGRPEKKDLHSEPDNIKQNTILKKTSGKDPFEIPDDYSNDKKITRKQTSESSTQSRQSDSVGSVVPVITISTTESDDEKDKRGDKDKSSKKSSQGIRSPSDPKSLRRQSSVDSTNEHKTSKEGKHAEGHKYQYSL